MMAKPKEERRRTAEGKAMAQREKAAIDVSGKQFDAEQSWRNEQEQAGRQLFATVSDP